jgi:hypothetical protein
VKPGFVAFTLRANRFSWITVKHFISIPLLPLIIAINNFHYYSVLRKSHKSFKLAPPSSFPCNFFLHATVPHLEVRDDKRNCFWFTVQKRNRYMGFEGPLYFI